MPIRTTLQRQRTQWVLNALGHISPGSLHSKKFISWIASNSKLLGITLPTDFTVSEQPRKKDKDTDSILPLDVDPADEQPALKKKRIDRYDTAKGVLEKSLKACKRSNSLKQSELEKNLLLLAEKINLSEEQTLALLFYIDFRGNRFSQAVEDLRDDFNGDEYFEIVGFFLGQTQEAVQNLLSPSSPLKNFITYSGKESHWTGRGYVDDTIDYTSSKSYSADKKFVEALSQPATSADRIIMQLLGPTPQTRLTLNDFEFLGKDRLAYFVESVRGAVESNGTSLKNSCLYGQPGVGKTELTAVIARHLGIPLYAIGLSSVNEKDALADSIKEPSRQDRLLAWRRAKFLVNAAHIKCIFLIDEAEDILRDPNVDKTSTRASKSYLNDLLDQNNVPTVFITNKIDSMEGSTVRRELPILEVQSPSISYKRQTLLKYADQYKIQLTEDQVDSLMNEFIYGLELAVIERVLFITSRRKDIEREAVFRALQIGFSEAAAGLNEGALPVPRIQSSTRNFDPRLTVSGLDIVALTNEFKCATDLKGLSVCIYGPQGAGKKTLLQYMAEKLSLEPRFVNFNDLYGAGGFDPNKLTIRLKAASNSKAMIIFNDVSRLLSDNERPALDSHPFFRAIEAHDLPVGIVLPENIGDLSKEQIWRLTGQFTFASRVSGLDEGGQRIALEKIVGLSADAASKVLSRMKSQPPLVVGDFVRVAKQLQFQPSLAGNPDAIFKALEYNAMQAGYPSFGSLSITS